MAADSLAVAIDPLDTLTGDARKAYLKERERAAKEVKKAAAAAAKRELLAKIAAERKAKARAKLDAQAERAAQRDAARRLKAESKLAARRARAARKGRTLPEDRARAEAADSTVVDSLAALPGRAPADSLAADSAAPAVDSLAADSLPSADTLYRLIKGFRDVRIYRTDFQVVCDSMTAISTDSTIHLYIDPVLWNQNNQMTSDVMDIYTRDSRLEHAEFVGSPMMAAQLDSVHYNQIAGKQMAAYFRDNEIYREDVNGNVQTIYYMQDGEPPQITMMSVVESGAASFYIEDRQLVAIVYRTDPVGHIYPMDQIPEDQELYLKGFAWEGPGAPPRPMSSTGGSVPRSGRSGRSCPIPTSRSCGAWRSSRRCLSRRAAGPSGPTGSIPPPWSGCASSASRSDSPDSRMAYCVGPRFGPCGSREHGIRCLVRSARRTTADKRLLFWQYAATRQ